MDQDAVAGDVPNRAIADNAAADTVYDDTRALRISTTGGHGGNADPIDDDVVRLQVQTRPAHGALIIHNHLGPARGLGDSTVGVPRERRLCGAIYGGAGVGNGRQSRGRLDQHDRAAAAVDRAPELPAGNHEDRVLDPGGLGDRADASGRIFLIEVGIGELVTV